MHPRDIIDRPAPARLTCSDCFEPAVLTDREMPLCLKHASALGIVSEADEPEDEPVLICALCGNTDWLVAGTALCESCHESRLR